MFPLKKLAELSRYVTPVGSYVDAYPVHLLTRASLAAMRAQTPSSDFDVRRFRPNLVLDTDTEQELPENSWCGAELEAPGATLRGEIPTIRCVMPTRAQLEVENDPDVLLTVATHAERCLGIYATVVRTGTMAVGDELRARHPPLPPPPIALVRARATTLKRGVLRAAGALIPAE